MNGTVVPAVSWGSSSVLQVVQEIQITWELLVLGEQVKSYLMSATSWLGKWQEQEKIKNQSPKNLSLWKYMGGMSNKMIPMMGKAKEMALDCICAKE